MEFLTNPLNLVTFSPLLGVLVLLFLPSGKKNLLRWTALLTSLLTFGLSIWMLTMFDKANPDLQMVINLPWIQVAGWNITFQMGVDGLSILLVLLTTFLNLWADQKGIDAFFNGLGQLTKRISAGLRRLQNGFVRSYALAVLFGVIVILGYLLLK